MVLALWSCVNADLAFLVLFCLFFGGFLGFFNTFLTRPIQLSYRPCLQYFGLPVSVTFPVYRNVNDEKRLSLFSVSKGCASLLKA